MKRFLRFILSSLLGFSLLCCGEEIEPTALRVSIDASTEVQNTIAQLELQVTKVDGSLLWSRNWVSDSLIFPVDLTFTMGADREVSFEALAKDSEGVILTRDSAVASFVNEQIGTVELMLTDCMGCPDGDADGDSDSDTDGDSDFDADFDSNVMYVNPGCDPQVHAVGIDAAWTQSEGTVEFLHVTQGTRRWAWNSETNTWSESLATNDLAEYWAHNTSPANLLNPGLDPEVQDSGITAAWTLLSEGSEAYLMILVGVRYFTQDLRSGLWTGDYGIGNLHEMLAVRATVSGSVCSGISPTNPGVDVEIQTNGVQAISPYRASGAFRLTGGRKLWIGAYDASTFNFNFTCTFENQRTSFIQAGGPTCTESETVNPGCDEFVADVGIDAAWWSRDDDIFHVTQRTRHWGLLTSGDVRWLPEEYMPNLAENWVTNTLPDCSVTVE